MYGLSWDTFVVYKVYSCNILSLQNRSAFTTTHFSCIFVEYQLQQLQFTVLKQSRDFSKFFNINKLLSCKCIFKDSLNSSLLWLMIHFTCIFVEYQTAAITDHSFKQSGDLSKTVISWKENFPCYRTNVISKLL